MIVNMPFQHMAFCKVAFVCICRMLLDDWSESHVLLLLHLCLSFTGTFPHNTNSTVVVVYLLCYPSV